MQGSAHDLRRVRAGLILRYPVRMMPPAPATAPTAPRARIFAPMLLAALGVFGMSAGWALLALIVDRHCAWMAVLTAADIALLMRLARATPGWPRAATTVVATLATILLANWTIAATQIGGQFGLRLVESIQRLGADHAQTLFGLANRPAELAWYAIAVIVALWLGR
jgi:hypothetical protein